MSHAYSDNFFDYIDTESMASAARVIDAGLDWLAPGSVLDVGCGRGAWLQHWCARGVTDVVGIDGDYVNRTRLHFPADRFVCRNLLEPFDLGRRFDLVQSLEVAEHLHPAASETFVASLCRHGPLVLFSAAVPGQGGEHHVNERPLAFWRDLFAARSYRCLDCVRPRVSGDPVVKPWYRYNTLLYVHESALAALPPALRQTEVPPSAPVPDP
ncbi:MAG: class I SAM-dependent methyltransferase, partial [Thermohalobaculum sp.]|nr:class I SAM-dependent methyltransferase [Thermohalobaculum sp.]